MAWKMQKVVLHLRESLVVILITFFSDFTDVDGNWKVEGNLQLKQICGKRLETKHITLNIHQHIWINPNKYWT